MKFVFFSKNTFILFKDYKNSRDTNNNSDKNIYSLLTTKTRIFKYSKSSLIFHRVERKFQILLDA